MSGHGAPDLPPGAENAAPEWVREASEKLHREHPAPCALMTTVAGKCTCPIPPEVTP